MNSYSAIAAINTMALCIYAGHLVRWLWLRHRALRAMERIAPSAPRERALWPIAIVALIAYAALLLVYAAAEGIL